MVKPDFRGARGGNAGDDFHTLWALRQALTLLDDDPPHALAVEGLHSEDEGGSPTDTWDGVDCTLYFGGDRAASATQIVIAQLKYSASHPNQPWSIARLVKADNKKKDNSVVGRLAKAFARLNEMRPELAVSGRIKARLVSNQPVDPAVLRALSATLAPGQNEDKANRDALLAASALPDDVFRLFVNALDLSECGGESRFAFEQGIIEKISTWMHQDSRQMVEHLLIFMQRAMLPESKSNVITKYTILSEFGLADPRALFPCPTALKLVQRPVPRVVCRELAQCILRSHQFICLHGEGGSGKTTAIQEMTTLLPEGSTVLTFDCYGGGRYLDPSEYRHRSPDAFLQLSNELAAKLRLPLLLNRSRSLDYPKAFRSRLEKAAEAVAVRGAEALLVVVVDAADNSITAAETRAPPDESFVRDFVRMRNLPANVRFIVTARTGRLRSLMLTLDYFEVTLKAFTPAETALHVRTFWEDPPQDWVDDFHYLSGGNPRVQRYALERAEGEPRRALDALRPNGKSLNQIFYNQFREAIDKEGSEDNLRVLCACLSALPRPIPTSNLAAIASVSEHRIRDLCSDLAPGVRLIEGAVSLADEDFEHFVRERGRPQLDTVVARVAEHAFIRRGTDAYAAAHVADALLAAGRRREVIELIKAEGEPKAVADPVMRREVHLRRLRVAMKVARDAGDNVDAILTLLIGAEALKTDTAIRQMFASNPDLAAELEYASASRLILRDSHEVKKHGPLLFHMMAADARRGNAVAVREGRRRLNAWLQRRREHAESEAQRHPHFSLEEWLIRVHDIAAETEAALRIEGPRAALQSVSRWRPSTLALHVASALARRLITAGDASLLQRCIAEGATHTPWDLFVLTPLTLAGEPVELSRLEAGLAGLLLRSQVRMSELDDLWDDDSERRHGLRHLETILVACEAVIARGGDRAAVTAVLERFTPPEGRRRDKLFTSQVYKLDLGLRAYALLERLAGRAATLERFWLDPPELPATLRPEDSSQRARSDSEKKEELRNFIEPILSIYNLRAGVVVGSILPGNLDAELHTVVERFRREQYRMRVGFSAAQMKVRAALSLVQLMAAPGVDSAILWRHAQSFLSDQEPFRVVECEILSCLALDRAMHNTILHVATERAKHVKSMRASADDKLAALTRLVRLILPISRDDAQSLFRDAVDVAGEVSVETIHELRLFDPLAERAATAASLGERRSMARDVAIVASDAGIRLADYEHFPWQPIARALARLDLSIALAATARWEDSAVVSRETLLPPILEIGLAMGTLPPAQAAALSPLLDDLEPELIARMVDGAKAPLRDHLAQEELLRFGCGRRSQVNQTLAELDTTGGASYWTEQLMSAAQFQESRSSPAAPRRPGENAPSEPSVNVLEKAVALDAVDWIYRRFTTPAAIDNLIAEFRAAGSLIPVADITERMLENVAVSDRLAHIVALSESETLLSSGHQFETSLARAVDKFYDAPAVNRWCRENLLKVISRTLPSFTVLIHFGESSLPVLLERSGASDPEICAALLDGIEQHIDTINATTVYALARRLVKYCAPWEAAKLLERYVTRLVHRIPASNRDNWDLTDVPVRTTDALARFLFALMSDVDVRVRWRGAHALRALARLGETGVLDSIVGFYGRTSDATFRDPTAPFYWLASRLWLLLVLDRIADETPGALKAHASWLLRVACDESFPHVLIRAFAKAAVGKLAESGEVSLSDTDRHSLERVNTSSLPRKKARSVSGRAGHSRLHHDRKRRFEFDFLDTIPYWYRPAARRFADLTEEQFLDVAEQWIVDRWGVAAAPGRWLDEPRRSRFPEGSLLDHRQGSRSAWERFRTYLEWHAMWCAAGELMLTHPLKQSESDDYFEFERWLQRNNLSSLPPWRADLRRPKPLNDRLWFQPLDEAATRTKDVSDLSFLVEAGLSGADEGPITVDGFYDTRARGYEVSARVRSALVSPATGGALVRALQTIGDSWGYSLPSAGDYSEIDDPPYVLLGWLHDNDADEQLDDHDPLRYGIRALECSPSKQVTALLNLRFEYRDRIGWVDAETSNMALLYEAWSDDQDYRDEGRFGHDEAARSNGWRLRIDRNVLRRLLVKLKLDLIIEVEITRGRNSHGSTRHEKEEIERVRCERFFVLRRDGAIEAAKGCLGAWSVPGA